MLSTFTQLGKERHCDNCECLAKTHSTMTRGPFFDSLIVTGPEKLFYVWGVYFQDRDINSFEIQTLKISGNETEWTGSELRAALLFLRFRYGFPPGLLTFEKGAPHPRPFDPQHVTCYEQF